MTSDESREAESKSSERERTKKYVRWSGRLVFLGGGFAMFVLMMVGVVRGIQGERAWDPYTGEPHHEGQCLDEARQLMLDAGELEGYSPPWDRRYVEWVKSCKESHPSIHEMLRATHSDLQKRRDKTP